MRILLVEGGPDFGNRAKHVCDLATGLYIRGHDVSVICGSTQVEAVLHSSGVPCDRLCFSPFIDPVSTHAACGIVKRNHVDIIHTHGVRAGVLGRLAARIDGRSRVVHTVHNLNPSRFWDHAGIFGIYGSLYKYSEAKIAKSADRVIALSDDIRLDFVRSGVLRGKAVTIHSGVDLSQYKILEEKAHARGRIGVPSGCRLVGAVLNPADQSSLTDFFHSAKAISKQFEDTMFVVIGEAVDALRFREAACVEGISHKVVFAETRKDMASILPGLDLFVMGPSCDNYSVTLLDAMAAGLPVVAVSVNGASEVVIEHETGYLVDIGCVDNLTDRISRLLSDHVSASVMGTSGRRRVMEKFGLDQMIHETEQIYLNLAERGLYTRVAEAF